MKKKTEYETIQNQYQNYLESIEELKEVNLKLSQSNDELSEKVASLTKLSELGTKGLNDYHKIVV